MPEQDNDKIPVFKNWNYWYVLVVGFLILLIIFFSLFTKKFS